MKAKQFGSPNATLLGRITIAISWSRRKMIPCGGTGTSAELKSGRRKNMDQEMQGVFDRIDELVNDLTREYESHLNDSAVTERAKNLFHEVLIKMRAALDMTMMRIWLKYRDQNLNAKELKRIERQVHFPICDDRGKFDNHIKRLKLDLVNTVPQLQTLLLQPQSFKTQQKALSQLRDLANLGKHVQLAKQNRQSQLATRIVSPDGCIAIFSGGSGFRGDSWGDRQIDPITGVPADCTKEEVNLVTYSIPDFEIFEPLIFCRSLQFSLILRYVPTLLAHV